MIDIVSLAVGVFGTLFIEMAIVISIALIKANNKKGGK